MDKKLEDLPPHHVVDNNECLFQDLVAALNMSQGFSLATGAIGRVLLTPLVEESPTGKLEANRLIELFLTFLRE